MADIYRNWEHRIIDHFLRNSSQSPPATLWVEIFTALTGDANYATAVTQAPAGFGKTGTTTERPTVAFAAPSAGVTSNTAQIQWTNASGSSVTPAYIAITSAAALRTTATDPAVGGSGNLWLVKAYAPGAIANGATHTVAAGDLTFTLT